VVFGTKVGLNFCYMESLSCDFRCLILRWDLTPVIGRDGDVTCGVWYYGGTEVVL
jgi:hypothetical protein